MNEYIIKQIKENKIINNALCSLVIHELHYFEYNKEKYVIVYISSPVELLSITLNDKKAIQTKKEQSGIYFAVYKASDLGDEIKITSYKTKDGEEINVKKFIPVDYLDYDLNENNLKILKQLKLLGLKQYIVLPKVKDNYWICSCGNYNTDDVCSLCGAKKNFATLYSSEKDIQQSFIRDEFRRQSFNGEDIKEQISKFKSSILKNKKYSIKEEYLTDSLFNSLDNESKQHVKEYKYHSSNKKQISKIIIFAIIGLVILIVIAAIASYVANQNNISDEIKKYCDTGDYTRMTSVDEVIDNYSCGTFIYYLSHNNLSEQDIMKLIDSDNESLYKSYYNYKKENLHNKTDKAYIKSKTYLTYLLDNDFNIDSETLNELISTTVKNEEFELFKAYLPLASKTEDGWHDDFYFLDFSCFPDEEDCKYITQDTKKYVDYAYAYHELGKSTECFTADLFSLENMKLLFNMKDNKVCQYKLSDNIEYPELIKNYVAAGGDFTYTSYLGNFYHHLLKEYINEEKFSNYKESLELLFTYDKGINNLMEKDDVDPGYSPLDTFIKKNYDYCKDARSQYNNSAYKTQTCNMATEIYKKLKNHGAKCNKLCDKEQYFK